MTLTPVWFFFRISAENRYGVSKPGPQSDVVINTETEVVDSSDDEGEHSKYIMIFEHIC